MLLLGTNSRSLLLRELPTPGSSHRFSGSCTLIFILLKKTGGNKNTFKGASSFLCLSFQCRNILCKNDCMPPLTPPPPPSHWACGISPSHSLADWVIPWFPPDVLQYTFPDRLRLRHGSPPQLCLSFSFFYFADKLTFFLLCTLSLATCEGICHADGGDAEWPVSCLFLALTI